MKGKYKAALALLLLFILLPLTLLMTLAQWVPTLAGIWLPVGTRIAFEESPKLTRHALAIPDLRYLVEDCEIARIDNVTLSHPSRWKLDIGALDLNSICLSKIPQSAPSTVAPQNAGTVAGGITEYLDHGSPSDAVALAAVAGGAACVANAVQSGDRL
ncbi:Dicarboxylate transport [Enterobacter asburiae]|uniref:Dicarboxylate transport n=1 Tax=Enterobacter asburiae TaxID=61645 RepID=A0A376FA09_ENTAS|nr:Dicarboxylate transport [Enterobacter asburiae]